MPPAVAALPYLRHLARAKHYRRTATAFSWPPDSCGTGDFAHRTGLERDTSAGLRDESLQPGAQDGGGLVGLGAGGGLVEERGGALRPVRHGSVAQEGGVN